MVHDQFAQGRKRYRHQQNDDDDLWRDLGVGGDPDRQQVLDQAHDDSDDEEFQEADEALAFC